MFTISSLSEQMEKERCGGGKTLEHLTWGDVFKSCIHLYKLAHLERSEGGEDREHETHGARESDKQSEEHEKRVAREGMIARSLEKEWEQGKIGQRR